MPCSLACSVWNIALLLFYFLLFGSDCFQAMNSWSVCSAVLLQLAAICGQVFVCVWLPDVQPGLLTCIGCVCTAETWFLGAAAQPRTVCGVSSCIKLDFKSWIKKKKHEINHRNQMRWIWSRCSSSSELCFALPAAVALKSRGEHTALRA